ncbi:hypothetical protein CDV36_014346 [Fusarium kuroshium]|uniref:Uncharacterized protein n=1 Tax=Fusarium kuroshium TaxID=2010991 RepID=A0A3M2RIB6_9HYPO|nr:hypothetical protein CDV36_014346 [Fusarium kuroshium]
MSTTQNPNPSWLAPYEVRHGRNAVLEYQVNLERHEILHRLRGDLECHHRVDLELIHTRPRYYLEDLSQLGDSMGLKCWNKTVPIFLLKGPAGSQGHTGMFRPALHNYLYHRWFRPYRSDIEYGQFIAHIFYFQDQPAVLDEDSAVELVLSMHGTICSGLDSTTPRTEPEKQQWYMTRPLFRAIAIAIQGKDYNQCDSVHHITRVPVLIILTGQDDGLSAPVTFDSITDAEVITIHGKIAARMSLETAIGFIMALEEREDTAFGPQPDPVASTTSYDHWIQTDASKLGWGDEPLTGPSSQWVDMNRYPDWTGEGARYDQTGFVNGLARTCLEGSCKCTDKDRRDQQAVVSFEAETKR